MDIREKLDRHQAEIKAGTAVVFDNPQAGPVYTDPAVAAFRAKLARHQSASSAAKPETSAAPKSASGEPDPKSDVKSLDMKVERPRPR